MSSTGRLLERARRTKREGFTHRAGIAVIVVGGGLMLAAFLVGYFGLLSIATGVVIMVAGLLTMIIPLVVGSTDDVARKRRMRRDARQAGMPSAAFAGLPTCSAPGGLCDCPKWHSRW